MKHKRFLFLVVLGLVVAFLAVDPAFAQRRTGSIRGTVKDESGEPLPGVAVELKGPALMGTRTETTDASGEFRFLALPIGADYEATFTLEGFQPTANKSLRVTIGGTITLDIILKPAAISTELTVVAQAPLVDVTKTSFSSNYTAETLETVPTRRYTFFDMVQASPGITNESQEDSRASAFGSERKSNAYYINGLDISAPSTGAAWPWPMPDIIAEIEVTGIGALRPSTATSREPSSMSSASPVPTPSTAPPRSSSRRIR